MKNNDNYNNYEQKSKVKKKKHFRMFFNSICSSVFHSPSLGQSSSDWRELVSLPWRYQLRTSLYSKYFLGEITTQHSMFNLVQLWRITDDAWRRLEIRISRGQVNASQPRGSNYGILVSRCYVHPAPLASKQKNKGHELYEWA